MAIRLTSAMAERVKNHLAKGTTAEALAHEVIELTQNDRVKVRVPGNIAATFKRPEDVGKTFKAVYGGFTADHILDTQFQRIQSGEYVCRGKVSDELKVSASGQASLGGLAAEHLFVAAANSEDPACNGWVESCFSLMDTPVVDTTNEMPKKPKAKKPTAGELVNKM